MKTNKLITGAIVFVVSGLATKYVLKTVINKKKETDENELQD